MTSPKAAYAHELVPHLPEDEEYGARWAARYHVARAAGLLFGWYGRTDRPEPSRDSLAFRLDMERLSHALVEADLALLSYALLTEQPNPQEWVRRRTGADAVGEWLYEVGVLLGIDMDRLRPYEVTPGPDGVSS